LWILHFKILVPVTMNFFTGISGIFLLGIGCSHAGVFWFPCLQQPKVTTVIPISTFLFYLVNLV
jgi:hypothetical protein